MSGRAPARHVLGAALAAALVAVSGARGEEREARVSLDLRDAPVVDIVTALADVGGLQAVLDPGVAMASLLQRTLPPTARVTYDARTNTLIVVY